ncbi:MAG: hypothetical protein AAF266_07655, partial [Planctomycetota bacterium]
MYRPCLMLAAAITAAPIPCLATFPEITLDDAQFAYASEFFAGENFAFGTEIKYTQSTPDGFPVESTGLQGFIASPEQIAPIPGFQSGQEVPLVKQTLVDLFPLEVPEDINHSWAENTISGVGDFNQGFTEFSIHQRKVTQIDQTTDDPSEFADIAAITKGLAPFELDVDDEEPVDATFLINFDSLFESTNGGFGSEGVSVQLLNLTDLDNVELVYEVDGFYFADENSLSSFFGMGETDLSDNFTFNPATDTDPALANFTYEMDIDLDPTMTYGINVISDSSAGASGTGTASIDSSNTLDVTLRLLTPGARLVIPGSSVSDPTPGDANGDGAVDLLDLDILGA